MFKDRSTQEYAFNMEVWHKKLIPAAAAAEEAAVTKEAVEAKEAAAAEEAAESRKGGLM